MNKKSITAVALAAVALLPSGALGAGGNPVATGDYEAMAQIDKSTFALGEFTVAKENGKRKLVAAAGYSGIYYPDAAKCDPYDVPLSVATVPISKAGRFHVKDEYAIADEGSIKVDWKGRWTKAKRVKGSIKISFDGCADRHKWTAERIG